MKNLLNPPMDQVFQLLFEHYEQFQLLFLKYKSTQIVQNTYIIHQLTNKQTN